MYVKGLQTFQKRNNFKKNHREIGERYICTHIIYVYINDKKKKILIFYRMRIKHIRITHGFLMANDRSSYM